ncbi:MAG: glycosyltransferase, partial [Bacteroidota bacterium]
LNDSSFNEQVKALQPHIVLFDRFITEEQFGWRVKEVCQDALCILDTIDLHCLRNERHLAIKQNLVFKFEDVLNNELALREIASIYRCDISLMVSEVEMDILENIFKLDKELLHYCAFMFEPISEDTSGAWPDFEQRKHFISIGNFLHEPNWDAVLYLKQNIWPGIRSQLPKAELHIYGAYTTQKVLQLHNEKEGFIIKGRAENLSETMTNARLCLAPLRFGAGIKGKLADSMLYGTPNVSTAIGAESMHGQFDWNGFICDAPEDFIQQSVKLYSDKALWLAAQKNGINIIQNYFEPIKSAKSLLAKIEGDYENLKSKRQKNFLGKLLQQQQFASNKYMSLWIESKNNNVAVKD